MDAMLEQMTLEQFCEWIQFFKLEPFGFPVDDSFHARQMWASLKASASKEWSGRPEDFMINKPAYFEVEVDPVEYLSGVFGPPPPRPAEDEGPPGEVS